MTHRTVDQWSRIFDGDTGKPLDRYAERILGDLTHYRHGGSYEDDDRQTLTCALLAFAKLFGAEDIK